MMPVEISEDAQADLNEGFLFYGKEFSGRFVVRLKSALHRRLAAKALAAGESLNSYCAKALSKA